MEDLNIIRDDTHQTVISKILFERPISRLHARKIGLLAGRHARLKVISDVYQIVTTLNHDVILVAEEALKQHTLPADIFLQTNKTISQGFGNTDEAFELLSECEYVVVGMDLEIGAQFQLFLEKLIAKRSAPIVFTNESIDIGKTTPGLFTNRSDDLYICNTQHLLALARYIKLPFTLQSDAGVLNKLNLLQLISHSLHATVVCIEDYQILTTTHAAPKKAVVSNIKNDGHVRIDLLFTALLTSLLCDTHGSKNDILDRVVTASYLLRTILDSKQKLPQSLSRAKEV